MRRQQASLQGFKIKFDLTEMADFLNPVISQITNWRLRHAEACHQAGLTFVCYFQQSDVLALIAENADGELSPQPRLRHDRETSAYLEAKQPGKLLDIFDFAIVAKLRGNDLSKKTPWKIKA